MQQLKCSHVAGAWIIYWRFSHHIFTHKQEINKWDLVCALIVFNGQNEIIKRKSRYAFIDGASGSDEMHTNSICIEVTASIGDDEDDDDNDNDDDDDYGSMYNNRHTKHGHGHIVCVFE